MLEKDVLVSIFEFFRNLEVTSPGNVVPGELHLGSAGNIAFDRGANVGRGFVHEGVHLVLLDLDGGHDVVPLDGDFIGSTVFDDDFAVLITVNADQ